MNWLTYLRRGYQFDFYSSRPLEECRQILQDQSRREYFQSTVFNWFIKRKKSNVLFVDVHVQTQHISTFRIEQELWSTNVDGFSKMEMEGKLERVGITTRVVGKVTRVNAPFGIVFLGAVLLFFIGIGIDNVIYGRWNLLFIEMGILPLMVINSWLFVIRPINQFATSIKKWLGDEPSRIASKIRTIQPHFIRQSFDFYTPDSIETCMDKLCYPSYKERYQQTLLGMVKGLSLNNGLFIITEQESAERNHFLIEQDALNTSYRIGWRMLGTIQTEGDITHVQGRSYLSNDWLYLIIYGLFLLGVGVMSFRDNSLTNFEIAIGVGCIGFIILSNRGKQINNYPTEKILGKKPLNQKNVLDFHSPYPLDDCVNMLLNYSEPQDYETPWGIGKGIRIDDELLVVLVEEKDTYRLMFGFDGAKTRSVYAYLQVHATLQPEGYGTRVVGGLNRQVGSEILWAGMIATLFVIFVLMFTTNISFIPVVIAVMGIGTIGFHINVKKNGQMLMNYPQAVLGQKAHRKQKVADKLG